MRYYHLSNKSMTSTNNKANTKQESKPVIYDHIYPNIKDWPIYKLSKDRDEVVQEVTEHAFKALSGQFKDNIGRLIARTIYLEKIRTKQNPWKADPANELQYWRRVEREYGKIQPDDPIKDELELSILKRLINRYTEEIVGSFDVRTFKFGRRFLTAFFSRLLNTARGRNIHRIFGSKHRLQSRIKVYGEVEKVRELFPQGTVVVLPTHFSNLDSILIGYAIDAVVGLPPFSYGAGLNLYDSEIISYFMNRLGAYRVDRRKKNPIYLETLKSFSSISIQRGTNTIFFPGGTRSRDGSLESTLKLGLLNTLIQAQRGMLQQGSSQKIIVVPLILGYHFVLEAEQLINQHLKRSGEEKYIGERSKPIKMREFFKFIWKVFSESSEITMSLGEPMDVFGNKLDEEGRSLDHNGRPLDIAEYFMIDGQINRDKQRENVYTRQLAEKIVVSYHAENHVLTSHMVAFTGFQILRNEYPELDVFGIIRLPEEHYEFNLDHFQEKLALLQQRLIDLENRGKVKMSPEAKSSIQKILDDALVNLGVYHSRKPLKINKKGLLISESFKLLYYYNNRLDGYGLEDTIDGSFKMNQGNWSSIED
jgi:glycerol-3-phosphate O-acyltransferase